MFKNKISTIIFFSFLFIGSLALGIILGQNDTYKLTGTFINIVYYVGKVFALLSILAFIYFKVKDDNRVNNNIMVYATVMIQLIPLSIRLLLVGTPGVWIKILGVFVVLVGIASFIGLYIFGEIEEEDEEVLE